MCSTYGGSNPGTKTELIHSLNDNINMICGCAMTAHPSAFASVSVSQHFCCSVTVFVSVLIDSCFGFVCCSLVGQSGMGTLVGPE